jgi:hypothetical protein
MTALVASASAALAVPGEVKNLVWCGVSKSCLEWTSVPQATSYRVYRGETASLPCDVNPHLDSCLDAVPSVNTTGPILTETPISGRFYWYLVTAVDGGGEGPSGSATQGPRQVSDTGTCGPSCYPAGAACTSSGQCCSASCLSSICQDACCVPTAGVCSSHGDCCSGVCSSGQCQAFSYPPSLDLTAASWTANDDNGHDVTLANDAFGGLYLDIPVMPDTICQSSATCDHISYLYTSHVPTVISGTLVVTFKVETTGNPTFSGIEYNTQCPTNPPTVRPLIWAHDNSRRDGDRWWSHDIAYILASGTVTLSIPIDPANFSGVNGEMANQDHRTLLNWNRAINRVSSLGFTFGAGCSYSHGIFITPTGTTGRFTVLSYQIVP